MAIEIRNLELIIAVCQHQKVDAASLITHAIDLGYNDVIACLCKAGFTVRDIEYKRAVAKDRDDVVHYFLTCGYIPPNDIVEYAAKHDRKKIAELLIAHKCKVSETSSKILSKRYGIAASLSAR